MHRLTGLVWSLTAMVAVTVGLLLPATANASTVTNPVTYVAGVGGVYTTTPTDTDNDCATQASPCATLGNALEHTDTGGIVYVSGTLTPASSVAVDKAVTIAANPAGTSATINGSDSSVGLLFVSGTGSGTATLSGLTFEDSQASLSAITSVANLTIDDSTFLDNKGGGDDAGAITNQLGATLTVNDSSFNGNSSTASGGAIANSGTFDTHSTLTVTGSSFSGNSSTASGGAITSSGMFDGQATLTVTGSSFSDNRASGTGTSGNGGAIDNADTGGNGTATVSGSSFAGNTAAGDGGAIDSGDFSGSGTLSVTNSSFTDNTATDEDGGAIDNADESGDGMLTVSGSTFDGNSAGANGGGIDGGAIDNGDRGGDGIATVSDSTFTGNSAPVYDGGAIDNGDTGGTGTLTVLYSTFSGNTAAQEGATIANAVVPLTTGSGTVYLGADILDGTCDQASGTWHDEGYNAATSSSCLGSPAAATDAPVSAAAGDLGALADSGGPTDTVQLLAGNPAINLIPTGAKITVAGVSTDLCPVVADQRGIANPGSTGCDAGAVQYATQTVSFTSSAPTAVTAGGATYTPTATSSSGLPVSLSIDPSTTNSACSISGNVVSFKAAGSCVIDANQAGNVNFAPAQSQQTITVTAAPAPPSTPPNTPGTPPVTPASVLSPHISLLSASTKVSDNRLGVRLKCTAAPCTGTIKLEITKTVTVKHGRKKTRKHETVVLGSGHFTLTTGQTSTIKTSLNATGRRDLTSAKHRRLAIEIVATATGGNKASRRETIQAAKPKR